MPTWRIERLSDAHDRSAFDCGKPPLDDFLKRFAGQYERRDFAAVYVAISPPGNAVLGYYSLSSGSVDLTALPEAVRKKLPRHPVPVIHLGRLAVDQSVRGQGLGRHLLVDALTGLRRIVGESGRLCRRGPRHRRRSTDLLPEVRLSTAPGRRASSLPFDERDSQVEPRARESGTEVDRLTGWETGAPLALPCRVAAKHLITLPSSIPMTSSTSFTNRLAHETSPYLGSTPTTRSTGIRGGRRRWPRAKATRSAHLPQHRLLGLPLVPRHGA